MTSTRILQIATVAAMASLLAVAVAAPQADSGRPLARRFTSTPAVSVPCGDVELVAYPADHASPFASYDWGYITPVRVIEPVYDSDARFLYGTIGFHPSAAVLSELRERLFQLYEVNGRAVRLPEQINLKPLELLAYQITIRDGAGDLLVDESDSASTPVRHRSFAIKIPAEREDLHRLLKRDPRFVTIKFRAWYGIDELKSASAEVDFSSSVIEYLRERVTRPGGPRRRTPDVILVTRDQFQDLSSFIREKITVVQHSTGFDKGEGRDLGTRALERAERLFDGLRPIRFVELLKQREDVVAWGATERTHDVAAHLQNDFLSRLEEHRSSYKKELEIMDQLRKSRTFELDESRFYEDVREKLKGSLSVNVIGMFGGEVDLSRDFSHLIDDQKKRVRDFQQTLKDASTRESILHDRHDQVREGQIRASLSIPKELEIYAITASSLGAMTGSAFRTDELVRTGRVSLDTILSLRATSEDAMIDHGFQVADVKISASPGDQGPTWLVPDGRPMPVRDYPALYRKIGQSYCRFPDGRSHDHDLDRFCLPDYRGVVLPGNDDMGTGSRGLDPGRTLGGFQEGGIPSHQHDPGTATVDISHFHHNIDLYHVSGSMGAILIPGGVRCTDNACLAGYPYGTGGGSDLDLPRPFEAGHELPSDLKGNRIDNRMAVTSWAGNPKAPVVGRIGAVVGTRTTEKVRVDNMSVIYLIKVR
jgi:microcystin-dependent protein